MGSVLVHDCSAAWVRTLDLSFTDGAQTNGIRIWSLGLESVDPGRLALIWIDAGGLIRRLERYVGTCQTAGIQGLCERRLFDQLVTFCLFRSRPVAAVRAAGNKHDLWQAFRIIKFGLHNNVLHTGRAEPPRCSIRSIFHGGFIGRVRNIKGSAFPPGRQLGNELYWSDLVTRRAFSPHRAQLVSSSLTIPIGPLSDTRSYMNTFV